MRTAQSKMSTLIVASAAGTALEWYDFFIYGALASIIAKHFFSGVDESTAFIFSLLTFAAGFAVRPIGAIVFGHVGDRTGRKRTFIVTIVVMGLATVAVGLLPDYRQVGMAAPILLVLCRILQGFALGGEYGGAAIYVAEHSPAGQRGRHTGWIQTSAAFGLVAALSMVLVTRSIQGEAIFAAWGWRIPFLVSFLLLLLSLWIRLRLQESPVFQELQRAGECARAPLREAVVEWRYLRSMLVALFGVMMAQGVIWYTCHFYAQFFMERVLKVEPRTVNLLMIATTAVSAFFYAYFARLSDRVGRKPVMLAGIVGAALLFVPAFHWLARAANPSLTEAMRLSSIVLHADPQSCSLQFDPIGKARYASSCDIAKTALATAGVSYINAPAPGGQLAQIVVGKESLPSIDGLRLTPAELKKSQEVFTARLHAVLTAAGYPERADPARVNFPLMFAVLLAMVICATALYGPQAAALVELFPPRIRYTALSLPYNIGTGIFGGFLPATAFAIVATTGNIYSGLWYPVIAAAIAAIISLLWLPETRRD
jgi:MFS family permease